MILELLSYQHENGKGHSTSESMELEIEKDKAADLGKVHEETCIDHIAIFNGDIIDQKLVYPFGPYKSIVSHAFTIIDYLFFLLVCRYIIHEHHDDQNARGDSVSLLLLLVSPILLIDKTIFGSCLFMQVRKPGI